jgi:hypothetical protein
MSDLVENGGSGGSWPLQPGESHNEYFELCALSTTNLLSPQERRRLEEHLGECPECREVHAQYQAMVDVGLPSAILDREEASEPASEWSLEEAEAKLFARLEAQQDIQQAEAAGSAVDPATPNSRPRRFPVDAVWHQMWWQFAAAALLVLSLCVSLYRTGLSNGEKMVASRAVEPAPGKLDERKAIVPAEGSSAGSQAETGQVAALRAQLENRTEAVAQLEAGKTQLEQRLFATQKEREQLAQNADQLSRNLEAREAEIATVRERLVAARNQDSENVARLTALEHEMEDLKSEANRKDQELAREQELLDHDRDIRDLMGSRKLYIAEVYDVAKNGQTQRPFGRVFYTQGKSLIFYAYDLDQQSGIREASAFQAWGRKGPNTAHAVNLGILYADNATKKRWVLKSDDPKLLEDIDAIFVTVEPHGGSNHPSGKPLLFAYLRIEPNHP